MNINSVHDYFLKVHGGQFHELWQILMNFINLNLIHDLFIKVHGHSFMKFDKLLGTW